jgi:hypothetical protein
MRRGGNPLERFLPEMGGVGRNAGLDPLQKDAEAGVEAPVKIVACLVSRERPEDAARGWQPVGDPSLQTLQQFAPLEGMPRRLGALGDRDPWTKSTTESAALTTSAGGSASLSWRGSHPGDGSRAYRSWLVDGGVVDVCGVARRSAQMAWAKAEVAAGGRGCSLTTVACGATIVRNTRPISPQLGLAAHEASRVQPVRTVRWRRGALYPNCA